MVHCDSLDELVVTQSAIRRRTAIKFIANKAYIRLQFTEHSARLIIKDMYVVGK